MIKEEKHALEKAKSLIKAYSLEKHLINHLINIEKIITVIDTPASLNKERIVLIKKYITLKEK